MSGLLSGKHVLIVGIANEQSIAFGVAQAMRQAGANIAVTYLNAKAERFVRPLAESLGASITAPLDAAHPDQEEALFARIAKEWGRLDIVVHSIAFAPRDDLQGRVVELVSRGLCDGHGHFGPFLRAALPIGRTADDRWRRLPDHELLRRRKGGLHL